MRLRRKSEVSEETQDDEATPDETTVEGPYDADDLPADDAERVDLGSLLITPEPGRELRLQVDEASGAVQSPRAKVTLSMPSRLALRRATSSAATLASVAMT